MADVVDFMPKGFQYIVYTTGLLIIIGFTIAILVMNDKSHDLMFDDLNKQIRTDTKEGNITIAFITIIAYIFFNFLMQSDLFTNIREIIPNYANGIGIDSSYFYSLIEIIAFTTTILGMNVTYHDAMFDDVKKRVRVETPEGIATIVFISLLAFKVLYLMIKYVSGNGPDYSKYLEPINKLFYIIPALFSFIMWIINNIFNLLTGNGNENSIFSDFDRSLLPTYTLLFIIIGIIISVLYTAAHDPKSLTTNTYVYIIMIMIPLLFGFYNASSLMSSGGTMGKTIMLVLLALILVAGVYFYINMNISLLETTSFLSGILMLLIVMVGLAMFFYVLSNYLKSLTGWTGFIVYFIFYIPCLLIDFSRYILKEFEMTSKVIHVLFFVELLLILLYIFVPKLFNSVDKRDAIVLLENGAFLDVPNVIGSSKLIEIPSNKLENTNMQVVYQKNFAFSMWIYLNVQPNSFSSYAKETPIFDFGNGKPKIVYYNNITDDNKNDKYIIYFTDVTRGPTSFELSLPIQKWNNFVFNYTSSQVDLFINGELVKTFKFKNNAPYYKASDNITTGSEKGLDGAICNVRYYPYNLSISHITTSYNLLMYNNPPVIQG
jgi:Concanavalin A-like lectin/glucanases superfamily